jgi:6-phosphogluconolactonase (cycloisomerase 2 family)
VNFDGKVNDIRVYSAPIGRADIVKLLGESLTLNVGAYHVSPDYVVDPNIALRVGVQEQAPTDTVFNGTGSILYVLGADGDDITAYPLGSNFDVSSYTSGASVVLDISNEERAGQALAFNSDGSILYVLGDLGDDITAYPLDTNFDVSSYTSGVSVALDISGQESHPRDMLFNNGGSILYVLGSSGDDVTAYPLDTNYDISSYSAGVSSVLDASALTDPTSFTYNGDGSILYVLGDGDDEVKAYPLGTNFDISSYSSGVSTSFLVRAEEEYPQAIFFNNVGTKLYILGSEGDDITEYTPGTAFDLSTIQSHATALNTTAQESAPHDMLFNDDGTVLYILGDSDDDITEYPLVTAYDPSSYNGGASSALTISGQDGSPRAMIFNDDGTILYMLGTNSDTIYAYPLDTAYDISSYSSGVASALDVSGTDSNPRAIFFNGDGSVLYLASANGDDITSFPLDTNYDISSYSSGVSTALDVGPWEQQVRDAIFNNDGTVLYTVGIDEDEINAFPLSTPYDPSSYTSGASVVIPVGDVDGTPHAIMFNEDGSRLYLLGAANDDITTFNLEPHYTETSVNSGGVGDVGAITVQLNSAVGATFQDSDADNVLDVGSEITIANTPTGLTPSVALSEGDTVATITFSGTATSHANANDSSELTLVFDDTAFSGGDAAVILRSGDAAAEASGAYVDFLDPADALTYGMFDAFDISSYESGVYAAYDIGEEENSPEDLLFNDDGTWLYLIGAAGDDVDRYTLSRPYDISTVSQIEEGLLDTTPNEPTPRGMIFNDDGTALYVIGTGTDAVNEYILNEPYDVGDVQGTVTQVLDVSGQDGTPTSLIFNGDGTSLYMLGDATNTIYEYPLDTAYDASSYTAGVSTILDVSAIDGTPRDLLFNNDGSILYVIGQVEDSVQAFPLPTPYDISSYVADTVTVALDASSQEGKPRTLAFNGDGSVLFVLGYVNDTIYAYPLDTATTYPEASANDGSINNAIPLRVSLFSSDGHVFQDSDTDDVLDISSEVTLGNVPDGLTPVLSLSESDTKATLTFTGNATSHEDTDDVSDITFAFDDSAFSANDAGSVVNSGDSSAYSTNIGIDFTAAAVSGGGGSSAILPRNTFVEVNGIDTEEAIAEVCASGVLEVKVSADRATRYLLSLDEETFVGASWKLFESPETIVIEESLSEGEHVVYALFRSSTGNTSSLVSDTFTCPSSEEIQQEGTETENTCTVPEDYPFTSGIALKSTTDPMVYLFGEDG